MEYPRGGRISGCLNEELLGGHGSLASAVVVQLWVATLFDEAAA